MSTPGGQQQPRRFEIAFARGEMQRAESFFRARLQIGPVLDEQLHDVGMAFRRRPHQRRLVLRRLLRVHVRAARNQHADGVGAAACPRTS